MGRGIFDETTGEWFVRMIILVMLMLVFGYGGSYFAVAHGVGYTIGIGTAVVVSELFRLRTYITEIKSDLKDLNEKF